MTAMPSTSRPARPSKYGNVPTVVDGIRFASKAEARRYGELKLLERAVEIFFLTCQPQFPFFVDGQKSGEYVGDFSYLERYRTDDHTMGWRRVCEDVKGVQTSTFKLKWKLVKALYPDCDFRLITKKRGVPLRASSGRVGERAAA